MWFFESLLILSSSILNLELSLFLHLHGCSIGTHLLKILIFLVQISFPEFRYLRHISNWSKHFCIHMNVYFNYNLMLKIFILVHSSHGNYFIHAMWVDYGTSQNFSSDKCMLDMSAFPFCNPSPNLNFL